ncbi:unnamed protein product, partial [Closterium sp. NIES-54]
VRLKHDLNRLAMAKLPIWLTELDFSEVESDEQRADYLEAVMREAFSHPSVAGMVLWSAGRSTCEFYKDIDSGMCNACDACLADSSFTDNEAGKRFVRLRKEWNTHLSRRALLYVPYYCSTLSNLFLPSPPPTLPPTHPLLSSPLLSSPHPSSLSPPPPPLLPLLSLSPLLPLPFSPSSPPSLPSLPLSSSVSPPPSPLLPLPSLSPPPPTLLPLPFSLSPPSPPSFPSLPSPFLPLPSSSPFLPLPSSSSSPPPSPCPSPTPIPFPISPLLYPPLHPPPLMPSRYQALRAEWSTHFSRRSRLNSPLSFTAFHGRYRVRVSFRGQQVERFFDVPKGAGRLNVAVQL